MKIVVDSRTPLLRESERYQKNGSIGHTSSYPSLDQFDDNNKTKRNQNYSNGYDSIRKNFNVVTEPVSIAWYNINVYSSQKPSGKKKNESVAHIIKNVSGQVNCGQILAIMGSSGAGKTTLLNVLTARNLSNVVCSGIVQLNGKTADTDTITSLSAYVQQDDLFISTLTVREHLLFQSLVRLDSTISKADRCERIEQVIRELGLNKCAETRIGNPALGKKGISGGEMKRLAFASEVLTNPSIMFCDEPTSGLDSFMAQSVVSVLRDMAVQGRTVICTIHQPSSEVFAMFDQLLLLADGRVAYMGKSDDALAFFHGLDLKCPQNFNPADFYIRELAIMPGEESQCKKKLNYICNQYSTSTYAKEAMPSELDRNEFDNDSYSAAKTVHKSRSRYKVNFCRQFTALLWRSFLTVWREPMITVVRVLQTLFISFIIGLVYWEQSYDQNGIMNINGALFLLLTNMSFENAFSVINTFCGELPIFLREHNNGMYRVGSYFLAKMLAEVPTLTMIPTLFVGVQYYMIGFETGFGAFMVCQAVALLVTNCAASLGYLISCASSSITMALAVAPPILIPLLLFGGYYLNTDSIPDYFLWLKYLSWYYYSNEALIINQWSSVKNISCLANLKKQHSLGISNITDMANDTITATSSSSSGQCLSSGAAVLKMLNFDESNYANDFIFLITLIVAIRLCAYLALLAKSRNR